MSEDLEANTGPSPAPALVRLSKLTRQACWDGVGRIPYEERHDDTHFFIYSYMQTSKIDRAGLFTR